MVEEETGLGPTIPLETPLVYIVFFQSPVTSRSATDSN